MIRTETTIGVLVQGSQSDCAARSESSERLQHAFENVGVDCEASSRTLLLCFFPILRQADITGTLSFCF